MKATIPLLILPAVLLSACASTPAAPPRVARSDAFIGYVTPYVGTTPGDTYRVTTNEVRSPRLQISRVDDGFRGVIFDDPIDLRVDGGGVTGSINGQPIKLHIEHRGGKTWVKGIYGGRLLSLFFAEQATDSSQPCGMFQPWISISTSAGQPPEPASCDVASVATLARMMTYLDEDEALALLTVMLLGDASVLQSRSGPRAPPRVSMPAATAHH